MNSSSETQSNWQMPAILAGGAIFAVVVAAPLFVAQQPGRSVAQFTPYRDQAPVETRAELAQRNVPAAQTAIP